MSAWVRRHPVLAYYILVFTISWGGMLIVVWPGGFPSTGEQVRSLPVAMLMHAVLSASTLILQPSATGTPYLIWNLILAGALWVVVGATALAERGATPARAGRAETR